MDVTKTQVAEWWSKHPQDYMGWNAPSQSDEAALLEYFRKADEGLRRDHADLHEGHAVFARLIPYAQIAGRRVLEVGCGLGAVSESCARAGARVAAVDLSEFGVRAAQRRMRVNKLDGRVIRADAEKIPFAANTFDFVWSWGVIHHTPRTAAAVAEIHRVLKPGGSTCVMVYHRTSIYAYVNIILRRGVFKLQLLKKSVNDLLTRYSDGRESGGCPLAQYFVRSQAREMFGMFARVSISVHGCGSDLINVLPSRLGIRRAAAAVFPDRLGRFLMSRFGHFLIIQATK